MDEEPDHTWTSEMLSEEAQKAFFAAARSRQEAQEHDAVVSRRDRFTYCIAASAFAVLCAASTFVMAIRQPKPQPPHWVLLSEHSGIAQEAVPQKDAPKLFNENTRLTAIRDFITACESYIPETWARMDYHACMIRATPDEQRRREADIGRGGKRYPPAIFGDHGWAMPTDFLAMRPLEVTGNPPNQIFHYKARYERTEMTNGRPAHPRWTADIYFTLQPDLPMTDADRLLNLVGMQTVSFSTTPE